MSMTRLTEPKTQKKGLKIHEKSNDMEAVVKDEQKSSFKAE